MIGCLPTQALAFLVVFVYVTQAIAFVWKPGLILACRSAERAEAARADITKSTGNDDVVVMLLDLAYMSSVKQFAEEFNRRAFSVCQCFADEHKIVKTKIKTAGDICTVMLFLQLGLCRPIIEK